MPITILNTSAVVVLTRVFKQYTNIINSYAVTISSLLNNLHHMPIRFSFGDEMTDFKFITYFI